MAQYFDDITNLMIAYDIVAGQVEVDLNKTYYVNDNTNPIHHDFGLKSESALYRYLESIVFGFLDEGVDHYNSDIEFDSKEMSYWQLQNY